MIAVSGGEVRDAVELRPKFGDAELRETEAWEWLRGWGVREWPEEEMAPVVGVVLEEEDAETSAACGEGYFPCGRDGCCKAYEHSHVDDGAPEAWKVPGGG